jgi:osmotically-inducible protein OsmY
MTTSPRVRRTLLAAVAVASLALAPMAAQAAKPDPLTDAFRALPIAKLHVTAVDQVLVVRGEAWSPETVQQVSDIATRLGYRRVANLVRVVDAPDDEAIERRAERQLTGTRALDGCDFTVDSTHGVLRVAGTVRYEVQKELAMNVLRRNVGALDVQMDLRRTNE